jgi:hypothetical protein
MIMNMSEVIDNYSCIFIMIRFRTNTKNKYKRYTINFSCIFFISTLSLIIFRHIRCLFSYNIFITRRNEISVWEFVMNIIFNLFYLSRLSRIMSQKNSCARETKKNSKTKEKAIRKWVKESYLNHSIFNTCNSCFFGE